MSATPARIESIVKLAAELSSEDRAELVKRIAALEASPGANERARVGEAIRRVVRDHPTVLAALAK